MNAKFTGIVSVVILMSVLGNSFARSHDHKDENKAPQALPVTVSQPAPSTLSPALAPVDIVSKDNLSKDLIKTIFENAYMDIKIKENGDLVLTDSWPIYIDIDQQKRFLTFSVYWPVVDSASDADKFTLMNTLSKDILCISSYFSDKENLLSIKYDFWIEGGVTVKNIISTEKILVKCLGLALEKDVKRIIK